MAATTVRDLSLLTPPTAVCLITAQESGFVFTPTQTVAKWQWSDDSDMIHVIFCRAKFVSNTRHSATCHEASATQSCTCHCDVTTNKEQPTPCLPNISCLPSCSLNILYICRKMAANVFYHDTLCWVRMCFCHIMRSGVLSAFSLCLLGNLFLQQPLSRSVLN